MFGGEGIYWIRNKSLSSKFIDIRNNPYVHGGERSSMPIGLLSPRLTRRQLWLVEQVQDGESFIFHNYDTGTVLDIQDGSSTEGTSIIVQSYAYCGEGASSQHWQIVWVSDDYNIPYYRIVNQKTRTVLDLTYNTRNGPAFSVESWNFHGGQHQLWVLERATFPTMYWLINVSSKQCLQYNPSSSCTASLDVKTEIPSRNQLWYLESLIDFDGYYRIRNVNFEDRVLDLSGGDYTSILGWTVGGADNQNWKILDVDMNGVVNIICGRRNAILHAELDGEGVYHPRGASNVGTFDPHCRWSLIPCPIPSLFGTAAQRRDSGKFVAQSGGSITTSNVAFDHGSDVLRNVLIRRQLLASQLPLVRVSEKALKSWTQDNPTNTETLLSEEITITPSPGHYVLANRALIRAQLEHWALAAEDVKESLQVQPSPIGYIAMAVVLLGQGDREGALCTFDRAFHDCEPRNIRYLLLLKSILVFESGNQGEAIMRVEHLATRTDDNDSTYLYSQARASRDADMQVLGIMHMKKGDYGRAIPLVERARNLASKDKQCPLLKTISLIYGWSFNGLVIIAQQRLCETLYAEERTAEAMEILLNIIGSSEKETQGSKEVMNWVTDFTKKCAMTLEDVGDEAFRTAKPDDAITQRPTALFLSCLFIKRSKTRAANGSWEDALRDASEAVKADPSHPWGYEAKYVALHAMKRYDEAIDAFESMLHAIEQSHDSVIKQLRKSYISPSETIAAIDHIVRGILEGCPLVVIDVFTGYLCDGPDRVRIFKADPTFKELVSSTTNELDNERARQVVESFFGYVMFSHAWQGNEPLYKDVKEAKSVWDLPDTPLNEKLRNFCKEARRLGHKWAWSDTCCIDKTTSSILNQSLTSMYKCASVKLGDLTRSFWMTRAWTLQELLAPKVIFFYDSEWKPYLGDTGTNHKESPEIMKELADAINISGGTIVTFSPDDLGMREKLRLASTRNATVKEDVAYSLIGIFKSDIRPHYGEGADALGHLLEEIVARSGEVTVLAWSGKSSSYNSCLPAFVSVYSQTPYIPPLLEGEAIEACVTELRGKLPQREALDIYDQINSLPLARFATRRLHLPCIVFPVRALSIQGRHRREEMLCRAKVSGLGNVEFTTTDDIPLDKRQKFVLVHPWIGHIRGSSSEAAWEDDSELDTDSDLGSGSDAGSDEVVLIPAAPTPRVGDYTRALHMIARLGQPFNALLLVQQPNGDYRRVAAENEIVVSGLGTNITSRNIRAKVLEIL
ncbi:hypothetical protein EDC04DRAFT_3142610 [Pisolithus marmoratus]|nr:hypothetical protein EDC04DRAFT_3142610 [Pisolithus marmoratus]